MHIEIATNDTELVSELERARMEPDIHLPCGILIGEVTRKPSGLHGISVPDVVSFTVSFAVAVGANVLSAWLYDKMKGRVQRVKIDGHEAELTSDDFERVVRTTFAGCNAPRELHDQLAPRSHSQEYKTSRKKSA